MLAAMFDESGTHDGSHAVAVAGYIAEAKAWDALDAEWRALLHEDRLKRFHMKEHVKLKRSPRGTALANARFDRYIELVNRTVVAAIGVVVDAESYRRHVKTPAEQSYFGNRYCYAAMTVMGHVGRWAEQNGIEEGIAYHFEQGAIGAEEFISTYRKAYCNPALRHAYRMLGDVSLKDKNVYRPIQTADIPAFLMHRAWPNEAGSNPIKPVLYELYRMYEVRQHRLAWINDEIMEVIKAEEPALRPETTA